jgi:hypothetical protein
MKTTTMRMQSEATRAQKKASRAEAALHGASGLPAEILVPQKSDSAARLAELQRTCGAEAVQLVTALGTRHAMVHAGKHPAKPYVVTGEDCWSPLHPSRDAAGEAMVRELAQLLRAKSVLFEDPLFPADDSSLYAAGPGARSESSAPQTFRKDQDPFLAGVTGLEWRRPADFGDVTQKVVTWSGSIDPDDVAQVCYLRAPGHWSEQTVLSSCSVAMPYRSPHGVSVRS